MQRPTGKQVLRELQMTPNRITLGRIFAIFILISLVKLGLISFGWFSGLVFIALLTDAVDGWYAREFNQESQTGKILDPVADKLVFYSLMFFIFSGNVWMGVLLAMLALDVMSTLYRGTKGEGAVMLGKLKFVSQCFALMAFALHDMQILLISGEGINLLGNIFLARATILGALSLITRSGLPAFVTTINLAAGFWSMWQTTEGNIEEAFSFLVLGMVADFIDGPLARRMGKENKKGMLADDLADGVTFGAAPAWLLWVIIPGGFALPFAPYYLGAVIWRLYDYTQTKGSVPKGFFRGVPSPVGAGLVFTTALWAPPVYLVAVGFIAGIVMTRFDTAWIHFGRLVKNKFVLGSVIVAWGGFFVWGYAWLLTALLVAYLFSPLIIKPPSGD